MSSAFHIWEEFKGKELTEALKCGSSKFESSYSSFLYLYFYLFRIFCNVIQYFAEKKFYSQAHQIHIVLISYQDLPLNNLSKLAANKLSWFASDFILFKTVIISKPVWHYYTCLQLRIGRLWGSQIYLLYSTSAYRIPPCSWMASDGHFSKLLMLHLLFNVFLAYNNFCVYALSSHYLPTAAKNIFDVTQQYLEFFLRTTNVTIIYGWELFKQIISDHELVRCLCHQLAEETLNLWLTIILGLFCALKLWLTTIFVCF